MSSQLDKSLDEITAERRQNTSNRPRRGRGGDGGGRQEIRRSAGGVQKRRPDSYSSRGSSKDTWTHDLYDQNGDREARLAGNPLAARLGETTTRPARLKVENLHYDLTEEDLTDLFSKIGPVQSLRLKYDKLGRSDGVAFVTYTSIDDANEAIRKYNGANAAGQPITVSLETEPPPRRPPPRAGGRHRGSSREGPRHGGTRMSREQGGSRSGTERRGHRTQEDLDKELDEFMRGPVPAENEDGAPVEEEMAID